MDSNVSPAAMRIVSRETLLAVCLCSQAIGAEAFLLGTPAAAAAAGSLRCIRGSSSSSRATHRFGQPQACVRRRFNGLRAVSCESKSEGGSPMAGNKLLHAMIRVPSVERAVDFWKARGANVLTPNTGGKGACFVGYGCAHSKVPVDSVKAP